MKQTFTHFLFTVLSLCFCTVAVATTTVTISPSDFATVSSQSYELTKDGLTIKVSQGTVGKDFFSCFKNQTLELSSDIFIKSVEFTCTASGTSKYGPGCFEASTGNYTTSEKVGTWAGSSKSVTFTASLNQVRMTQIVVTLDESSALAANLVWGERNISFVKDVDEFEAPSFSKATNAAVTFSSDNTSVATVSPTGEISLAGGFGTAVVTASSPANEQYLAGEATCTITYIKPNTYTLADKIESGKKYILVVKTGADCLVAKTLGASASYGYLPVGKAKATGDDVLAAPGGEITITGQAGSYKLTDAEGRVMWMSGDYTSFQLGGEGTNDVEWSISISADGVATITNNAKGKSIQYSTAHKSFGSYNTDTDVFPYLYTVKGTNAIKNVSVAPADRRKFNLLGQPVSDDFKGIVISNGRMTVTK